MTDLRMTTEFAPSAAELAELDAELDRIRLDAWMEWLATDPVIDPDDEF
jgi:hypothetical protein